MASNISLKVGNPNLSDNQRTQLTGDVASGSTIINVASLTGFPVASTATPATYYYVVIGNYGEDTTEIVLVSNSTSTALTASALKFSHSASDPVTYLQYNQIIFYGLSETLGAKTELSKVDIDCSQQFTSYSYGGGVYLIFVTSYYRSATTTEESDYSEEITNTTFTFNSAKKIIEAGVRKALTRPDENPEASLSWSVLIDLLNEGLNEISTRKKKWLVLHKVGDAISTVENVPYIEKPSDLAIAEFLTINSSKMEYVTKMRYDQYMTNSSQVGVPVYFTMKGNKFYLYPVPNGVHSIVPEYYATPAVIENLSDTVNKEFATILIYFIAAQAAYIRNNEKRGNLMELKFQQVLAAQIEDVTGYETMGDAESAETTSGYGPFGAEWID